MAFFPTSWKLLASVVFIFIAATNAQLAAVANPPIVAVRKTGRKANLINDDDVNTNKNYDVTVRKYSRVSYRPLLRIPVTAIAEEIMPSTAKPPETNNINFPTEPTILKENLLDGEAQENCALSFILPNPMVHNQQVCVRQTLPVTHHSDEEDETLSQLKEDVENWKSTAEDLRNQIAERMEASELEPIQNEIRLLRKESGHTNFRISQLYMQLIHEILNKRDTTIEYTSVQNSVLNVTVKYYELKDKHEALVAEHNALQQQTEAQREQIERLQETMEELTRKVNRVEARPEVMPRDGPSDENLVRANTTQPPASLTAVDVFADCTEVQRFGRATSGQYYIHLPSMTRRMKVWCDYDQDPGGWTVIQRRAEGKGNFHRNLASYQRGFGLLDRDFWLGLENIHQLTSQIGKNYKLHIDMQDWSHRKTFVEYGSFKVESADDGYRLKVAHYSGTAGDSLTWHNNMKFTAKDADNDPFTKNCANYQKGGWWYNMCAQSNLNGIYYKGGHYRSKFQDGVYWSAWRGGSYSLKKVEMKIRPTE